MSPFRSLLFLPASRAERFDRARSSGADAVCLDLEDAVAPDAKPSARRAVSSLLAGRGSGGPAVGVRVNATDTAWSREDLAAAGTADFVMLPKTNGVEDLKRTRDAWVSEGLLWPLVETTEGLKNVWEIAAAPGVQGVLFGALDFSAEVGCEVAWEPLLYARGRLAVACARAQVELLDAPYGDLADAQGFEEQTRRAKALGFTGRACIHPTQVPSANAIYTPSQDEVAHAQRVLEAFEGAQGAAAQLDGKFIDVPVALAARRVLARTGA